MKDTIYDISHELFFGISGKDPTEIDLFFDENIDFPQIIKTPRMSVNIPLPREHDGKYYFLGFVFSNYETDHDSIWALYTACLIKLAAFIRSIQYDWEEWRKNKTPQLCDLVIQFITNIFAINHLQNNHPLYWNSIEKIEKKIRLILSIEYESRNNQIRKNFSEHFGFTLSLNEYISKIIQNNSFESMISFANFLYRNQDYILKETFPFNSQRNIRDSFKKKIFNIKPEGEFKKFTQVFDELWVDEKIKLAKMIKKYAKISEDLNFDDIKLGNENIGEYLRLKNDSGLFLKKLRSQLKMISNIVDDPNPQDLGMVEMQKAIQAMASQNDSIQIFEQEDARKTDENWAIIMDTSASMKLKFHDLKKFALCLSETADEMNSRGGKWGFFTFNNDFLIIKDHSEKYSQITKARIGGIENQGLSFIPDAITLATRLLQIDSTDKKFIFVITDGQTLGQGQDEQAFRNSIKQARQNGISVVGIGVPEGISKLFTAAMPPLELKKTVAKFIDAYVEITQSNM